MKMAIAFLGAALTAGSFSSGIARAGVTEYTNLGSFNAATTGATTYSFGGLVPTVSYAYYPSLTVGPTMFSGNGEIFVIGADAGLGTYGVPYLSQQYGAPNKITISTTPATAMAFDYGSYGNINDTLVITLRGGNVFNLFLPPTYSTTAFFGFTSSTPISAVSFADNSGGTVLDITDFTVAQIFTVAPSAAVPETATWAMILLGFGGLGFAAHRRASRKSCVAFFQPGS